MFAHAPIVAGVAADGGSASVLRYKRIVKVVNEIPITVVETSEFIRDAESLLTGQERFDLIAFLAMNPEAGDVMAGTGGVRKLRWGIGARGKRAGVRAIYYYHSSAMPLFLLNVFSKNEKLNLSMAERNVIRRLIPRLVAGYREGKRK